MIQQHYEVAMNNLKFCETKKYNLYAIGILKTVTDGLTQFSATVKILGLNFDTKNNTFEDMISLRYGKLMIMADQDEDSSHCTLIAALNVFNENKKLALLVIGTAAFCPYENYLLR